MVANRRNANGRESKKREWSRIVHIKLSKMKKLEFKIDINANAKKVWDTFLNAETFKEMIGASYPGSYYKGQWKKGENVKFLSAQEGGTLANIVEMRPYEYILAKHIAVINADGSEDRSSEQAKGWIGTTEEYNFNGEEGKTELKIVVNTTPEWASMFTEGWPNNLKKLKEICERSRVGVATL